MDWLMSKLMAPENLTKVGMFLAVQALVFVVLYKSSAVFSSANFRMRSLGSFRTTRSSTLQRRLLDFLSPDSPQIAPSLEPLD